MTVFVNGAATGGSTPTASRDPGRRGVEGQVDGLAGPAGRFVVADRSPLVRRGQHQLEVRGIVVIGRIEEPARHPRPGLDRVGVAVRWAVLQDEGPCEGARGQRGAGVVRGVAGERDPVPDGPVRRVARGVSMTGSGSERVDDDGGMSGPAAPPASVTRRPTVYCPRRCRPDARLRDRRVVERAVAVEVPGVGRVRHPRDRSTRSRRTGRSAARRRTAASRRCTALGRLVPRVVADAVERATLVIDIEDVAAGPDLERDRVGRPVTNVSIWVAIRQAVGRRPSSPRCSSLRDPRRRGRSVYAPGSSARRRRRSRR